MSKTQSGRRQHRSMRGKPVDMDLLRKRNELTPAIGNAKVNARGDELGPGGKIIKKREDVVKEHYDQAGKVRSVSGRPQAEQPVAEETVSKPTTRKTTKKAAPAPEELTAEEKELLAADEEWVEDDNGNFVKK